jgi:hypothetical protein
MPILRHFAPSLPSTILLSEVGFGLPLFLFFLYRSYSEGTLTLSWGVWLLLVWAAMAFLGAVVMWFTLVRPLTRTREASTGISRSNNRWRGP